MSVKYQSTAQYRNLNSKSSDYVTSSDEVSSKCNDPLMVNTVVLDGTDSPSKEGVNTFHTSELVQTFPVQVSPDPQTRRKKIHCKQELIISSLQKFYSNRVDMKDILEHLQGTSAISLRLIDWFVTNYAKQYNTSYILNNQEFLVYTNYKSQLKAYSKKLFDPFCRRERIMFQLPGQTSFLTTVGKLNFFRWAIEKGVLDYIISNLASIEKEMNTNAREVQKIKKQIISSESSHNSSTTKSSTRKRTRLIVNTNPSNSKIMEKHEVPIEIRFD